MKKIKLQKALLAICLALATTIKISNEITAMEANNSTINQNSNADGSKEQTNLDDTFAAFQDKHIEGQVEGNDLTNKELNKKLKDYIQDDITKYLFLTLLGNYELNKIPKNQNGNEKKIKRQLFKTLVYNYPNDLNNLPKGNTPYTKDQWQSIIDELNDIRYYKTEPAIKQNKEKILWLLFKSKRTKEEREEALKKLPKLIENYTTDKHDTNEQQKTHLLSFLEPVAERLLKENSKLNQGNEDNTLYKLAKIVGDFSAAYKIKPKQQKLKKILQEKEPKEQKKLYFDKLKKIAIYNTHTRALKYYVNNPEISNLTEEKYQQFLRKYINNNPVRYLALLIQASYDLIQFPEKSRDEFVNSHEIKAMLLKNKPKKLDKLNFMQTPGTTAQIGAILAALRTIDLETKPAELTIVAQILKLLFINPRESKEKNNNDRINSLRNLIKQYNSLDPTEVGHSYGNILSLLEDIATQLKEEANALKNKTEQKQLTEISKLVSQFSDAYKTKTSTNQPAQQTQPQAPQLNKQNAHSNNWAEREYQQFLEQYIKEITGEYLALLTQEIYTCNNGTANINRVQTALTKTIYAMLFYNYPDIFDKLAKRKFMDLKDIIEEAAITIVALVLVALHQPENINYVGTKLPLLFPTGPSSNNKDRLNRLKTLINKYKQKPKKEGDPTGVILRLLEEIEKQLQNGAQETDDAPGTKQQNELTTQIQSFFRAYKDKQKPIKLLIKLKELINPRIKTPLDEIHKHAIYSTITGLLKEYLRQYPANNMKEQTYNYIAKTYISNNPVKYLALRILEAAELIQFPQSVPNELLTNTVIGDGTVTKVTEPRYSKKIAGAPYAIADLHDALQKLTYEHSDKLTNAKKILALLFLDYTHKNTDKTDPIYTKGTLQQLIDTYKEHEQEQPPETYPYSNILSLLKEVGIQLEKEAADYYESTEHAELLKLVEQIKSFSAAYEATQQQQQQLKPAPQHQLPKQENQNPNSNANTRTLTEALKNNIEYHDTHPVLTLQRYKQTLKQHIDNTPAKYLAATILASYKLIPNPTGVYIYNGINQEETYEMLVPQYNDFNKDAHLIQFMDKEKRTDAFKQTLQYIYQLQGTNNESSLTCADQIIKQIFLSRHNSYGEDTKDRIKRLSDLIDDYRTKPYKEERPAAVSILSSLVDIATQLEEEAAAFKANTPEQTQLQQLAKQIRKFYNEYKNKQAENKKQENNTQSQPKNSTLTSKLTEIREGQDILNNAEIIGNKNRAVQKFDTLEKEEPEDEPTNKTNNTKETQITTTQEELAAPIQSQSNEDEFAYKGVDNKKTEINNLEITDTSLPKHHSEVNQDNKKGTNTKATLNHSSNAYHSQNDDDVSAKEPNEEEKSEHSLPTSNVNEQASNPNADNLGTHKIQLVEDTKETHEEENKENVQNDIETSNLNFNLTKNSDGPDVENDKNNTNQGGQKANKEEEAAKKMLRKEKEERINNNQALQIKDLKNNQSKQEQDKSKAPLQEYIGKLTKQVNQLTEQNKDIDDKHKTYLILRIQQTLSKLHIERIKKLTTLKNKLEQRQLHQQQTTKHSLQVTQQLLDLFEQLNQSGLLASITDDLEEPLKAIAQETKQFKKTSENYKQTIDQHDEQIKKLQQNYNELRNKLKQINLQQQ